MGKISSHQVVRSAGPMPETPPPEDELTLVSDNAFVDGLDTATDGEAIDFIGWRDGMFSYEAVSGAKKSVMKFTLTPPEGMVSVKAEEFGR